MWLNRLLYWEAAEDIEQFECDHKVRYPEKQKIRILATSIHEELASDHVR